ncbi:hypothetical protein [Virgibacillus dokdonensis]|uniref:Uncharacterized protein n=1 Tax=Virgibacillus dokdonensis TaxID=302167 RepID=A0A2K9J2E6_9BACI|nr:hypothetical protein [Virgibacillus dokdonensis]AUJ25203.1 hypothetical protein A21D_02139 [Virgibacillus dokdonensis]
MAQNKLMLIRILSQDLYLLGEIDSEINNLKMDIESDEFILNKLSE